MSEAGSTLALDPRVLRCFNRKLWRPTTPKSHVRARSNPILFRHGNALCNNGFKIHSFCVILDTSSLQYDLWHLRLQLDQVRNLNLVSSRMEPHHHHPNFMLARMFESILASAVQRTLGRLGFRSSDEHRSLWTRATTLQSRTAT